MSHSEYRLISKKGEGTFSEVLKAQSLQTGEYVAIKCMKNHFGSIEQVNNLREIQALKRLSPHDNIIRLIEVLFDQPTGECVCVCVRERERESKGKTYHICALSPRTKHNTPAQAAWLWSSS